ncbi:MAG: UDP-N-acetylmuramoyl-tripeptide--D-alanyl-D-alanine ligase [Chlamydiota bacterium]
MLPLSIYQIAHLLEHKLEPKMAGEELIFTATVDSRKKGDLFFALPGMNQDGHEFLELAKEKGALAAVVSKSYKGPAFGLQLIPVEDVLKALQSLARIIVAKQKPLVVAVTGSMGKTTTKEFLAQLLQARYHVYKSPGNANSQIGLPLSLLSLRGDEEVLVLEMGMTEKGQIANLTTIAPPDLAIITTVGLVHAVNFEGLEDILGAKAEIFSHRSTQYAVYSTDMPHVEKINFSDASEKIPFSTQNREAPFYAALEDGQIVIWEKGEKVLERPWPILGSHNVDNFLAAATAVRHLGVTWEEIGANIEKLELPGDRLELVHKGSITFLKDAYNANRNSLCMALKTLQSLKLGKRKVAVISEMLELGAFAEEEHRAVAQCALEIVDNLYCIGPGTKIIKELFDKAGKNCYYYDSKDILRETLKKELQEEDLVLIKGGRFYNLGDLVEHFEC